MIVLVLSATGGTGCGIVGTTEAEREVRVVATIFPLTDIVRQVGGYRVRVATLLSPGSSPHTFEPTVVEAMEVARADLVVHIGGGFDDWAIGLAHAGDARIIEITHHVPDQLLLWGDPCGDHISHHGYPDPHVWLDPVIVRQVIVPIIGAALGEVDPGGEATFSMNAYRFGTELDELHREIEDRVSTFGRREFIAYHSAWRYLAHRYDLDEVATVEKAPGKESSARRMAELVDLARDLGIDVLFAEPQLNPAAAEALALEIGGRVLMLDPLGGEDVPGRDSYLSLMRYNLDALSEGLR